VAVLLTVPPEMDIVPMPVLRIALPQTPEKWYIELWM
jgi:hypothetical protein